MSPALIVVIAAITVFIIFLLNNTVVWRPPPKSAPPKIHITDPRKRSSAADDKDYRPGESKFRPESLLVIEVQTYPADESAGIIEQLMAAVAPDYVMVYDSWYDKHRLKMLQERRPSGTVAKDRSFREIAPYSPDTVREWVELLREIGGIGPWLFHGFSEQHLASLQGNPYEFVVGCGEIRDGAGIYDLIVDIDLDRNEYISIYSSRPEQFDRIIEIVNSYNFAGR